MLPGKELGLVHVAIVYLVYVALIVQDREIRSTISHTRKAIEHSPSSRKALPVDRSFIDIVQRHKLRVQATQSNNEAAGRGRK